MARDSDTDPTARPQEAHDELAMSVQRLAANQRQRAASDLNTKPPAPTFDPVSKKSYYEYAPRPLSRLLGSPLAMTGKYATGPHSERRISSGWGDGRLANTEPGSPRTFHKGVDFLAPLGEAVLACGDGTITFVGYQGLRSGISLAGASGDKDNNILDAGGVIVAKASEVGFGGVFIYLVHNDDDFQGYRTEYFHLSGVTVKQGQKVQEGDVIGYVGRSGVRDRNVGPHLHFQVSYLAGKTSAVVPPTAVVPNYWPGHVDSTNSDASKFLPVPMTGPTGTQVAARQTANFVNSVYRGITMQNQDLVQARELMSAHAERVAQVANVHEAALYATAAAGKKDPVIVDNPMTFDFDTGTWSDGKVT